MLDMLWNAAGGNARKIIRLTVVVVHIDESALGFGAIGAEPPNDEYSSEILFLKEMQSKYKYV